MLTSYTFDGVTQRREVKTFCKKCDKKLKRVISRTYYQNGFHNEKETRAKNDQELNAEKLELEQQGVVCQTCEDDEQNAPVVKKKDKDTYEVFSRGKNSKLLGRVRRAGQFSGWVKWVITSPNNKKCYKHQRSIADAAAEIVRFHQDEAKR